MAESTPQATDPSGRPLPPQATMGLLNYLTATALDEDYAAASARRERTPSQRPPPAPAPSALVVLAAFGLLLMTAGYQTARTETVRQTSRASLVDQIREGRAGLADVRADATRLEKEVADIRSVYLSTSTRGRALQDQLTRLGVATGTLPVTGPGLEIVADDGPEDTPSHR